jgi:hypothetical protein
LGDDWLSGLGGSLKLLGKNTWVRTSEKVAFPNGVPNEI